MPRRVRSCGWAWLVLVVLLLSSCSTTPSPAAPVSASTPWVEAILGARSNASIVVRPSAGLRDPYWGPAIERKLAEPSTSNDPDEVPDEQVAPFSKVRQVDLFIAIRDPQRLARMGRGERLSPPDIGYVYVLHGLPSIDPLRITTRRGEPLFSSPSRLPSGVLELAPNPAYARRRPNRASTLYVMPDGTWVGVDTHTAPSARRIYAQTSQAPPPQVLESDALLGVFGDRTIIETLARRGAMQGDVWRRGLVGAGFIVHGGKSGGMESVLDYTSDAEAQASEAWIKDEVSKVCAHGELACVLLKLIVRDVLTTRADRRVHVRAVLSSHVLESMSPRP